MVDTSRLLYGWVLNDSNSMPVWVECFPVFIEGPGHQSLLFDGVHLASEVFVVGFQYRQFSRPYIRGSIEEW
jgi:hypothetical protein